MTALDPKLNGPVNGPRNDELHDRWGDHRSEPLPGRSAAGFHRALRLHLEGHSRDAYMRALMAEAAGEPEVVRQ